MFPPRVPQAHDFQTLQGDSLSYSHWRSASRRRGVVALIYSGSIQRADPAALISAFDLPDFDFFALDAGGLDKPGRDFLAPIRNLQSFVEHIGAAHGVPVGNLFLVGQGDGALALALWAHDHGARVRGLTLVAPTFEVRSAVPFARIGAQLTRAWRGPLSDEREAGVERTVSDAGAVACPVQLLVAGADRTAHPELQQRFFDGLSSTNKARLDLPGAPHDVFGAADGATAILAVRTFLLQQFDAPAEPAIASSIAKQSNSAGTASTEPPAPPQQPFAMRWRGRLSEGIRLGLAGGFDSGSALDHVYRAEPQGRGALGRRIDANYLKTIKADALRERMRHVQNFVLETMEHLAERRRDVRLIDIAAGPGRYLLDAIRSSPVKPGAILLRDIAEAEVRAGQGWIARYEMHDVARFEKADAFDRLSLASIFPRPTIAIASGLYELFEDDALVRRSLVGVGDAVQDGGYLIYTCAPWHPGSPPTGRRRSQASLDRLVEEAGFRKVDQLGDVWGLHTVSLAVRNE
ncbi:class I SAM-dependent methyltransferase family protein [Variovorax sp. RHLX14]|uniref:class I SAM-dependent methyltransferase family protein n=1 Tax=Variovorax sp. RHLX14 TaxID=1259731 RepID=UPI003F48648C